jgi:hypothetical protein
MNSLRSETLKAVFLETAAYRPAGRRLGVPAVPRGTVPGEPASAVSRETAFGLGAGKFWRFLGCWLTGDAVAGLWMKRGHPGFVLAGLKTATLTEGASRGSLVIASDPQPVVIALFTAASRHVHSAAARCSRTRSTSTGSVRSR